jgi:hypothetical protein
MALGHHQARKRLGKRLTFGELRDPAAGSGFPSLLGVSPTQRAFLR